VTGVLYGVKPVVVAVVAMAVWGLGRGVVRSGALPAAVGVGAAASFWAGVDPLAVLGAGAVVWNHRPRRAPGGPGAWLAGLSSTGLAASVDRGAHVTHVTHITHVGLRSVVAEFLKLGVIVFGSGYVLVAFLQRDVVHQLHWLGGGRLLDAVAAGQVTPGPVFTTATFVGYLVAGVPGGLLATLAIFLPSFLMVAALGPVVARVRRSRWASGALDGISAAAVGLMAGVGVVLAGKAFVDPLTVVVAVAALAVMARFTVNTAWLVLAGAAVGALHSL
jgi:chromate transporter